MNIYVGNLSYTMEENDVREVFEQHGAVDSVNLIMDRATGRKKGFGFVEMSDEDGQKAIDSLNGTEVYGRNIVVNVAKPRGERPSRF